MTAIKSSATNSITGGTALTVPFGSVPAVGDLVVVWLAVSNEIVTRGPGYNTTNQWFTSDQVRLSSTYTLSSWYHTWNAADSGSSADFSFIPAPTLGIGDKNLPSANAVAVGAVLAGPTGLKEHSASTSAQAAYAAVTSPLKLVPSGILVAAFGEGSPTFTDSDGTAILVQSIGGLSVFRSAPIWQGYSVTLTPSVQTDVAAITMTFNDSPSFLYNPPIIQEGPVAEDSLLFRYRLNRYYTVFNNAGTFSAIRYPSTDQVAAATQVFVNNAPISNTDRTSILAAGIGGDYISA